MNKSKAYKMVFDDLTQIDLFRGIYDARNGNEDFMDGIWTVMEYIVQGVSEKCWEQLNKEFAQNMIKSEKKSKRR